VLLLSVTKAKHGEILFSLRPAALIVPIMLHDGRQHERWTDVTD